MPKATSNWLLCQLSQMFFQMFTNYNWNSKMVFKFHQVPAWSVWNSMENSHHFWSRFQAGFPEAWSPMKRFPHISQKELEKHHLSKTNYLFVGYGIVCFVVNDGFYVDFQEFSLCCCRRDVLWPQTRFLLVISFEPKKIFSVPSNFRRCLKNFRHPSNSIQ